MTPARADFGTDDPARLTGLIGAAVVALLVALFLTGGGQRLLAVAPLLLAVGLGTAAFLRARASALTKRRLWEHLLDRLDLAGDETALDVGCGRGLVLCGLARRLPEGTATGIDAWRTRQQSGNHPAATEANLRLLDLTDRATVRTGDATALDVEDGSIDVATAGNLLDHLEADERRAAVDELVRVLRPGGRLVVVGCAPLTDVADRLRPTGAHVATWTHRGGPPYPRFRVLIATTERPG